MTAIALGAVLGQGLGVGRTASQRALSVRIVESQFGQIAATTVPGATCQALVGLPSGGRPHKVGEALIADADGVIRWSYSASAPGVHGIVSHTVTCSYAGSTAIARSEFELEQDDD